ncbi:head-tail adaptor protein [Trueperella pyogenes]|uniref:head-tail adaptor protein n=1 Tax=Trueperella pyogenes TaxID=1661 RepID=UPI003F531275
MSFGNLRHRIRIVHPEVATDAAGFEQRSDQQAATVRAAIELRHATAAWVNRAAYTKATALFRIRVIPGARVTTAMEIDCHLGRFIIDSVEVLHGRYVEILAHQSTPEGASNGQGNNPNADSVP